MKKHNVTPASGLHRQGSALAGGASSPRVRLRIDLAPGCAVGPGKIALLEAIVRDGSLSEAARKLEMSYRRAWVLLDDMNRAFEEPVVTTAVGGARGGGARVTEYGLVLVREFRALEAATVRLAVRRLGAFRAQRRAAPTAIRRRSSRAPRP